MHSVHGETQILDSIIPKLEAEGYSVYVHPSKELLPPILGDFVPDAIALGSPKNLAIEVVLEGSSSGRRLEQLQQRISDSKDWELRVYYVRPTSTETFVESAPIAAIEDSLRSVENLSSVGEVQPALLRAWATLEAIARALLPGRFTRPQTPGRLVEVLASEGHVTPSEADVLRRLAEQRNRFIHGNLAASVEPQDIANFVKVLRALLTLLSSSTSAKLV